MDLKTFDYSLPEELIAQTPLKRRDASRLMVIDRRQKTIAHDVFRNIGRYLPPESQLVVNNSKVIPARLWGKKERSEGKVEVFLLKQLNGGDTYETLMRPMRRIRTGERIYFSGTKVFAEVVDRQKRIVRFNRKDVLRYLGRIGHIPLPPYIRREDTPSDRRRYQTVYARHAGSVAAPTAGLHFSRELLLKLKAAGHRFHPVTLHINYATFKPVEAADVKSHLMHSEEYAITASSWQALKRARTSGRSVVAVGTTSCRTLETAARRRKLSGQTDLFIYPGFDFRMTDILVTNFHLPLSSLLMLVYAFGSTSLMKKAYREAVKEKYRFYSYGDSMIII